MTLSELQTHALGVIADYGPVPTSEVARHLICSPASARNAVIGLEKRGYVGPHYTSQYAPKTAYTITDAGRDALASIFPIDEEA